MSTARGRALGQCVLGETGCWGTGACSLPVLPVLTLLPTFLPGCSFSEFLGRAATANSLFLARVICTRWLCRVPTAGLRGAWSPSGPGSPQPLGWLPARGLWEAPAGTRAQPHVVPRSLLVAEEMRSLIVEKGPGPVEDDPDALVKGGHSRAGAQGPLPLEQPGHRRGWQHRVPDCSWILSQRGRGHWLGWWGGGTPCPAPASR